MILLVFLKFITIVESLHKKLFPKYLWKTQEKSEKIHLKPLKFKIVISKVKFMINTNMESTKDGKEYCQTIIGA